MYSIGAGQISRWPYSVGDWGPHLLQPNPKSNPKNNPLFTKFKEKNNLNFRSPAMGGGMPEKITLILSPLPETPGEKQNNYETCLFFLTKTELGI